MSKPLRVLLIEESEADADLITAELADAGLRPTVQRVIEREAFAEALREFQPDIVLANNAAPLPALEALDVLRSVRPATGLIVLAHTIDGKTAVACLRAGAADIVVKANLSRLKAAIEAARNVRRPLERLTPRQLQVLSLVSEGDTTREIARRLQISVKTVETHRGEVMKRLGIHDVVGVVRYAIRVGIIAQDA